MGNNKKNDHMSKLERAMGAAGDLAYVWNTQQDTIEWLGNFNNFIGNQAVDIPQTGTNLSTFIHQSDLLDRMHDLRDYYDRFGEHPEAAFDSEFRLTDGSGHYTLIHDMAKAERDEHSGDIILYGVFRRLSDTSLSRKAMSHHLTCDSLTGYLKRDAFCEKIIETHPNLEALCQDESAAIIVVGIDRLSIYNEAFGADITNSILKAVASRLDAISHNKGALISRIGGDRFAIFLPSSTTDKTSTFATQVLSSLASTPLVTPQGPVRVSVSIGSARFVPDALNPLDIVTRAESALQLAKDSGRGCYMPYTISARDQEQYKQWLQTGDDLVVALQGNRILLAYQPIVDANTGDTVLYECLVRMLSAEGELVNAGAFIPAVEHLGLARVIDGYVLKKAVEELGKSVDISFSVNVSAYTITDESWMRTLVSMLKKQPKIADRLVIEITESVAITDLEDVTSFVKTLQSMGIRVALDDFGAGYTSFSQIQKLGVDIVKIDKSFIRNMGSNQKGKAFVSALQRLAETCNVMTIGEGAETPEDADMLRSEGVNLIQGHFYGFPTIDKSWDSSENVNLRVKTH